MVVGALAAYAALSTGRIDTLRTPDAPWPAQDAKRVRDEQIVALGGRPGPGHDEADLSMSTPVRAVAAFLDHLEAEVGSITRTRSAVTAMTWPASPTGWTPTGLPRWTR